MMTSVQTVITDMDNFEVFSPVENGYQTFTATTASSPDLDMGIVSVETNWGRNYHRLRRASELM